MYQFTWKNRKIWSQLTIGESIPQPPQSVSVKSVIPLIWEEHCVECALPDCYKKCPLYIQRKDRQCARFRYGIYPNRKITGPFGFGADLYFKRWAKLETKFSKTTKFSSTIRIKMISTALNTFDRISKILVAILKNIFSPGRIHKKIENLRRRFSQILIGKRNQPINQAKVFYLQLYSPQSTASKIFLEIIQDNSNVCRRSLTVENKWQDYIIPFNELGINPNKDGLIRIYPEKDKELRLIITWLDLIVLRPAEEIKAISDEDYQPAKKVKCVAWDLDNSLWEGVIGEVGSENVYPKASAINLIRHLDKRGIIQTIVSKNEFDTAWEKIKELDLNEFFLYPAIHWGPKSESLRNIASHLNIGLNSFALIDDSKFERAEVSSSLPQVRVYDSAIIDNLLERKEFEVAVTAESRTRRLKYRTEMKRKRIAESWPGDYDSFLRSCQLTLGIDFPKGDQIMRCLELLQRSNQYNLSNKRYTINELESLLANLQYHCLALDVSDKYGQYGIVGFVSINRRQNPPCLTDFVLSCRVASKKIEETFIRWYARMLQQDSIKALRARVYITKQNKPLRKILENMPFICIEKSESMQLLELKLEKPVEIPDIIGIESNLFR